MSADTAPRYTSYPTAPHFHSDVDGATVEGWLAAIGEGERLSLYVHVPFCDRLCWFCACHTKQTLRYEPVAEFVAALMAEIELVGRLTDKRGKVAALHFGGGSPTMLKPEHLHQVMGALRGHFDFLPDAEISVEIDPNDIDEAKLDALAEVGLTRASLGIQDFDPQVQKAINREQSFADTKWVVDGLRARGVRSVNLDVLYGLPHQTQESVAATMAQVLSLRPDRIALFGYAHVPWFKKHQTMIDEAALPGADERLIQSQVAARIVAEAGYDIIGLDHFALPTDTLAKAARAGKLRRNFQGYTDDLCETLIGFGPSSVSRYRQGHAQNIPATGEYQRQVRAGTLPTARGIVFTDEDRLRGWVIEKLMCDFSFSGRQALELFGAAARKVLAEAAVVSQDEAPMLVREGDLFVVPEQHRVLVRVVAARFDPYFSKGTARHSAAV
ncbi:oxygen-independent coproporphyrinogen III oxidase [Aerobium aerolatum]|uniref:Coproporphyrinogen-III oxidase n=1 Tax=Aquamicrobium aerolatum DSM 21857 TaxID=1121003 RepID=A0A1I3J0D9_9HYPH|nr:oxygen-independent coproporphyrinogen III oxidase [Aquamicrobium aerolatum]SFI53711.1 oxygen-independent coproporphyrinogen-3 oxidase [Aquamicrobium aerolatum DSM 21857]